ncbi:MAG: helical backbone metal receptor [Anaerolineales bacterium]
MSVKFDPLADLPATPQRIVSLVPSSTESLFDLGFGERVVGITDYCVHPAEMLGGLPRLGGPKNPRIPDLLALHPDLVIANQEENTPASVQALRAAGVPVWVTFPHNVRQSFEVLWQMAQLFRSQKAATQVQLLEQNLAWEQAAASNRPKLRYFCPIWFAETQDGQPWYMTFNKQTYCHDLLGIFGGENVFAERERRYPLATDLNQADPQAPGERDTRYPRLDLEEVRRANPQMILLPDEPFPFDEQHLQQISEWLSETPAVRNGRVHLVDGSLITWQGTRLAHALRELPALFAPG